MDVSGHGVSGAVYSWVVEESVWRYSAVLHVECRVLLGVGMVYEFGDLGEWSVVGCEAKGGGLWSYACYPARYVGLCGVLSRPVCGVYGLDELCDVLGLPYGSIIGSGSLVRHQWVLGSMRGVRLFDTLRDGSGVLGGGCSCLWYGSGGKFLHSDIKWLSGDGFSGGVVFGWSGDLRGGIGGSSAGGVLECGVLEMCFDGDGGVGEYRRVELGNNGFVGGYKSYLSNDSLESYREWCFRNCYWRSFYRGVVVGGSNVTLRWGRLCCGVLCDRVVGGGSERFVCVGYRSGGSLQGVSLELDLVKV